MLATCKSELCGHNHFDFDCNSGQGVVSLSHIPHADLLWRVSPRCGNGITHLRSRIAHRFIKSHEQNHDLTAGHPVLWGPHIQGSELELKISPRNLESGSRYTSLCVRTQICKECFEKSRFPSP
jgi:hypothetical protein